jgi:RNA polymerase sigma factor (sigma-70 family)
VESNQRRRKRDVDSPVDRRNPDRKERVILARAINHGSERKIRVHSLGRKSAVSVDMAREDAWPDREPRNGGQEIGARFSWTAWPRVVHKAMLSLIRGADQAGGASTTDGPRDELSSLAAAFVEGDVEAGRTLLIAVGGTVLGAVRMVLGAGHTDVEDVAQDALIGLLEGLRRFRGECTVLHFAGRVAVLTAMAARRRQRTRDRWVVVEQADDARVPAGADSSPLAHLEATRRREAIRRLLDELPEPAAEAVALHFMLGYTVKEVAAAACVPVNTVWSRLRIGKERIRKRLEDDPTAFEQLATAPECGS